MVYSVSPTVSPLFGMIGRSEPRNGSRKMHHSERSGLYQRGSFGLQLRSSTVQHSSSRCTTTKWHRRDPHIIIMSARTRAWKSSLLSRAINILSLCDPSTPYRSSQSSRKSRSRDIIGSSESASSRNLESCLRACSGPPHLIYSRNLARCRRRVNVRRCLSRHRSMVVK